MAAPDSPSVSARDLLRGGELQPAIEALRAEIRKAPGEVRHRIYLFQLLCVLGDWDKALAQLDVVAKLDAAGTAAMVQTYQTAIACERLRADIHAGRRAPMLFGAPEPWLALLIEALLREGAGDPAAGARLRERALAEAPATAGTIDGQAFAWIADGDARLGPVLEAVVNGRLSWIPFSRLVSVSCEAPADLRDLVWLPATLEFSNGGATVALLPVRYPETTACADDSCRLARETRWTEDAAGRWTGCGQRMWTTDQGEYPLLELRELRLASIASAE